MATVLKIKRSSGTTAPSALAQGELALTYGAGTQANNGDRLFIGTGAETGGEAAAIDIIGGQYYLYNLDVGTYDIIFTAEYDDEQFTNTITDHDLSSSGNYTLNDTLNYILPKLIFNITK